MIDEKKLIEEIEKEIDGVIVKDTYSKGKNAGLRKARILVEEQTKIGGWIPCSEQLPKKNGRYLCTMKSEEVMECYYGWNAFHTSKMFFRRYAGADVIAWKPLPEAYHE